MSYFDIFFFPLSLFVSCQLDFIHGDCMAEFSSLVGMSNGWPLWLRSSFIPLSRNEIKLSSRVLMSSSSRGLTSVGSSLESVWSPWGSDWSEVDTTRPIRRKQHHGLHEPVLFGSYNTYNPFVDLNRRSRYISWLWHPTSSDSPSPHAHMQYHLKCAMFSFFPKYSSYGDTPPFADAQFCRLTVV